jgi:hypothetical protein
LELIREGSVVLILFVAANTTGNVVNIRNM